MAPGRVPGAPCIAAMRIMAVDDESFALKDTVDAVREAAPEAVVSDFQLPSKALAFAAQTAVDVAFLDIEMGAMNGLEMAKELKKLQPHANVVFVTGYSEYALDAFSLFASGYLLKPISAANVREALANLRTPVTREDKGLRVQTFGNFEVFMDGKPVHFPRSKAKELFAYLVHKRGTGCATRELTAVLFEDMPYTLSLQKQVQTLLSTLTKTLQALGAGDVMLREYNQIAVDVQKLNCDYYRFLRWDAEAVNQYAGEYMSGYSWAEFTIGYLDGKLQG